MLRFDKQVTPRKPDGHAFQKIGISHLLVFLLFTSALVTALSCSKELSCENCLINNKPPVAIAGPDQVLILPKDSALLDGSQSSDADGVIVHWQWTNISGPGSFNIVRADSAKTVVNTLVQGIYNFELKVTDDKGSTSKDTVQITIISTPGPINHPPVACAGADQVITLPANSLTLDASCSTDPDNNITGYLWTMISGPGAPGFSNLTSSQTSVTGLVQGIYHFSVKVSDAGGLFSLDTVQVTVSPQPAPGLVDVYVAGDDNGMAAYWKNGQEVFLQTNMESGASAIDIVGSDVYVSGWEGDAFWYGNNRAKYWKNGQEIFLTGTTGAGTTAIKVINGDVYVAGWEYNANKTATIAKYWKNGQSVSVSTGTPSDETWATDITVVGNKVYVSGRENDRAKYWVDGQEVVLTSGPFESYASSIAVVGNDVYVTGYEYNGTHPVAKYWKNGQEVILTNGSSVYAIATSIVVQNNDIYVVGWEGDMHGHLGGTGSIAKLWKNGQLQTLTNGSSYATTSNICLFGNDVYMVVNEISSNTWYPRYQKNGQPVTLPNTNVARASYIKVVPH